MLNDSFVAFWTGIGVGLVLGIFLSAILKTIADAIERGEKE